MMRRFMIPTIIFGLLPLSVAASQTINHDTTELQASMLWTNAVAIADVDLDNDFDLIFANGSSYGVPTSDQQELYFNDGSGNFGAPTILPIAGGCNAHRVVAEDLDRDGDLDLVFAVIGAGQKPRILINRGGEVGGTIGTFVDRTATSIPSGTTMSSYCVASGDVDDDGDLDLVFTDGAPSSAVRARLLINDGNAVFSDETLLQMPNDPINARVVALFDYDGDFDVDIALAGPGGAGKFSRLYLNDSTGYFSVDVALDLLGTTTTYAADFADLDGDGLWDASVSDINSGFQDGWGQNQGPGIQVAEAVFGGSASYDLDLGLTYFDYDMNGFLDVFVGTSAEERVYANSGGSLQIANGVIELMADSTTDIACRDLNGDHKPDMVTAQGDYNLERNKIYLNSGVADTVGPAVLDVEIPADVTDDDMKFRIRVQDSVVDDGGTNVMVAYAYEIYEECVLADSGLGTAYHMGGGLYRATVPTDFLTCGLRVTWAVTDDAGNTTEEVVEVGRVSPAVWCNLGCALGGSSGTPVATGNGSFTGGSFNTVTLTSAAPNRSMFMVLGLTPFYLPIRGGILVPRPSWVVAHATDGSGTAQAQFTWPVGNPAGIVIYWQFWISDAGGPYGLSASNGLKSTSQ